MSSDTTPLASPPTSASRSTRSSSAARCAEAAVRPLPLTPTGIHLGMPAIHLQHRPGASQSGTRAAIQPQRTASSSSINDAAHAGASAASSSSSGYFDAARTTHMPREPFTSVTACSRSQSPEDQRTRTVANRGGRRALIRSGTSGSLTVSSSPPVTPGSEVNSPFALLSRRRSVDTSDPETTPGDATSAAGRLHGAAKGHETAVAQGLLDTAQDAACFVDADKPKIDFFTRLPFELALYILYHLTSHQDLLRASAVSRTWRLMATDNAVWRERFFQNPGWAIRSDAELVLQRQDQKQKAAAQVARRREDKLKREERKVASAARLSSLRSWRETLHIPSLPDLSSLSLTASASLSLGGSASLGYSSLSTTRAASEQVSTPSATSSSTSGPSGRFGFFSSPARGSLTPAGRRRAQQASAGATSISSANAAAADADTSIGSIGAETDGESASVTVAHDDEEKREESFVSSLNWRKLYRDRSILEQRWRKCRVAGGYDLVEARPKSRSSPRAFEPSKRYLLGHTDGVYCVRHDEGVGTGTEGKVVSGSRDRTIRVWDTETGDCRHILKGHSASVLSLQYDDQILVSGSSDSLVFVWDFGGVLATTHQEKKVGEEGDRVVGAAWGDGEATLGQTAGNDGEAASPTMTSADSDGHLRPIVHTSRKVVAKLRGHTSGVLDVAFDDKWIVSCSKDTTVRVWKRDDFSFHRRYAGHSGPVNAARLQDSRVVSAAGDGSIHLWQIASGETLRTFAGHERGLACIAFSGNMVISGSNDQTIRTWDAERGTCLSIFKGHEHLVRAVAYDGSRRLIVSGGYDKRIKLWDADAPESPVREIKAHVARIFDIEFDCTRIVSASEDQAVCISSFGGSGIEASLFV